LLLLAWRTEDIEATIGFGDCSRKPLHMGQQRRSSSRDSVARRWPR
jgi:hypothetical protein